MYALNEKSEKTDELEKTRSTEPQKLSYKLKTQTDFGHFSLYPLEMASSSNSRWHNCKECPHQSTNNGNMVDKAKRN